MFAVNVFALISSSIPTKSAGIFDDTTSLFRHQHLLYFITIFCS